MNKVKKLLKVGDVVFSANGGSPMKITAMKEYEFETEEDSFRYDEVRTLFFLTQKGYELSLQGV